MKARNTFSWGKLVFYLGFIAFGYLIIFTAAKMIPHFYRNILFGGDIWKDPIYFQMAMWLPFFLGIADLIHRKSGQLRMLSGLYGKEALPGDPDQILSARDLGEIIKSAKTEAQHTNAYTSSIIHQVALKYQSAKSVDQASTMLSSLLDLYAHRLDLAYSFVRYLSWLIPSLGFMGTVYGISQAVSVVGQASAQDPNLLRSIATNLAVAFDTTLLALVQSSILLYFVHRLETKDEYFVNDLGKYVQENLINRLE